MVGGRLVVGGGAVVLVVTVVVVVVVGGLGAGGDAAGVDGPVSSGVVYSMVRTGALAVPGPAKRATIPGVVNERDTLIGDATDSPVNGMVKGTLATGVVEVPRTVPVRLGLVAQVTAVGSNGSTARTVKDPLRPADGTTVNEALTMVAPLGTTGENCSSPR